MAKKAPYYEDDKGRPYKTINDAVASDIAQALGQIGDGGEAVGIAKKIIENRAKIEKAFSDLDALAGQDAHIETTE